MTTQAAPDTMQVQLKKLREAGVLINPDLSGFGMFTKSATAAEWGIANADERHARLKGGQKLLIPEEYVKRLKSLEIQFRQLVAAYAYPDITYFKPYWFVPISNFETFKESWAELEKEVDKLAREIVSKYDEFVDLLASDFGAIAEAAWRGVKAQKLDEIRFGKVLFRDEAAFVDHVKAGAVAKMPRKSDIRANLRAEYRVAVISLDLDTEIAFENSQMAEIWKDQLSRNKANVERGASPVLELQKALRSRFALMASTMLDSVDKNGLVRGKVAKQIAGLKDFYSRMSVTDDKDLLALVETLTGLVGEVGDKRAKNAPAREVDKIAATLRDIIALADEEIKHAEVADVADRMSALEIEE